MTIYWTWNSNYSKIKFKCTITRGALFVASLKVKQAQISTDKQSIYLFFGNNLLNKTGGEV